MESSHSPAAPSKLPPNRIAPCVVFAICRFCSTSRFHEICCREQSFRGSRECKPCNVCPGGGAHRLSFCCRCVGLYLDLRWFSPRWGKGVACSRRGDQALPWGVGRKPLSNTLRGSVHLGAGGPEQELLPRHFCAPPPFPMESPWEETPPTGQANGSPLRTPSQAVPADNPSHHHPL